MLFMRPLAPPFLTLGDICPEFQSPVGLCPLCPLSPACNGYFRFTSGVTPTDRVYFYFEFLK